MSQFQSAHPADRDASASSDATHVAAQVRDARDLLTRLYREIGISAVAAALEVRCESGDACAQADRAQADRAHEPARYAA